MVRKYGVVAYYDNNVSSMHIYPNKKEAMDHYKNISKHFNSNLKATYIDLVIDNSEEELKREILRKIIDRMLMKNFIKEEVAEVLGLPYETISKLERG